MTFLTTRIRVRERGLLGVNDQLLAIILAVAFSAFMIPLAFRQAEIRSDDTAGVDLRIVAESARAYVQETGRKAVADYVAAVDAGSESDDFETLTALSDLAAGGYAPAGAGGVVEGRFGQGFSMGMRGVLRSQALDDPSTPANTVTAGDVIAYRNAGRDVKTLHDGVYSGADNDEIDLEAMLFSVNGDPVDPLRAARVVRAAGIPTVARLEGEPGSEVMLGAFGEINMDPGPWIGRFEAAGAEIGEGHFASVISAAGGFSGAGNGGGSAANINEAFLRCHDLTGAEKAQCESASDNVVRSSMVLGENAAGESPAISNLRRVTCRPAAEGDPAHAIAPEGEIYIDCDVKAGSLETSGDVAAGGDLTVNGEARVDGSASFGGPVVLTSTDGGAVNLNDALVIGSGSVTVGDQIPLPPSMCVLDEDGDGVTESAMPRLSVWASALGETMSRPITGFQPTVDESDGTAGIITYVSEDYCNNSFPSGEITPLPAVDDPARFDMNGVLDVCLDPTSQYYRQNVVDGMPVGDGKPDIYAVGDNQGIVNYTWSCNAAS